MLRHQQAGAWDEAFLDTASMPWVQKNKSECQYTQALRLAYAGKTQEALEQAEQLPKAAQAQQLAWRLRRYRAAEQAKAPEQRYDQFRALGDFLDSQKRAQAQQVGVVGAAWEALRAHDYWQAQELFDRVPTEEAAAGFEIATAGRVLADAAANNKESQKLLAQTLETLRRAEAQGFDVSAVCMHDFAVEAFLDGTWKAETGEVLSVDCGAGEFVLEPRPEGTSFYFYAAGLQNTNGVLAAAWTYRAVDEIEITVNGKTLRYFRELPA